MRIAHFVSNFPKKGDSEVYGKSLAAYNICTSLAERGHEIHVFTVSNVKKSCFEDHGNLKVHIYKPIVKYKSEGFSFKIFEDSLNHDFDLVHVHSGISAAFLAGYRFSVKKKVPLVLTWHGDSVRGHGRYQGIIAGSATILYKHLFAKRVLHHAKAIISPSEYYIDESKFLGEYRNKVFPIPNGINVEEFELSYSKDECKEKLGLTGKKVILFVGSLFHLKGPHVLLNSIPSILKQYKDAIFVFMGGGDVEKYQKISAELKVTNDVLFPGYVQGKLKTAYYNAADIFVLPSLVEVFPLVLLEASASSLPLVVSNLDTFKCIVREGYNGIFTLSGDENSLKDAILMLLKNDDLRFKMGVNAFQHVKNFSWTKIAEDTEKLYKKIITS